MILPAVGGLMGTRGISRLRSLSQALTPGRMAIGLLLLGTFLRFYRLGSRSLWLDEIFAADTTRFDTFSEVFRWATSDPQEMPLVNIIAWLLRGLGEGDWVVRLPAALAGSLSVFAMYALGKAVSRPRTGLVAALLMAVLPFAVWYSQEARPYAFLMLFTTLQMFFAYRAVRFNRARDWIWLGFCTLGNLYSHILALAATAAAFAFIGLVLLLQLIGLGSERLAVAVRRWLIVHLPSVSLRVQGGPVGTPGLENDSVRVSIEPGRPSTSWKALLAWRRVAGRIASAGLTTAVVLAAYYPWLPYLSEYLNRSGIGTGTNTRPPAATVAQVGSLLAAFGFSNPFLVVLAVGTVVVAAGVLRHRWREAALVALWVAIPIGVFWFRLGSGMVTVFPRYYSCLFPAGVLLVAIGVDGIAAASHGLVRHFRFSRRRSALAGAVPAIVASGVVLWLLAAVPNLWAISPDAQVGADRQSFVLRLLDPVVPALAHSYDLAKDDYKGIADYVIAMSPPDSLVIAMGGCASYIVKSLPYYFRIRRSPITVIDGAQVDNRAFDLLQRSTGFVWGVVFTACAPPDNVDPASRAEMQIIPFPGLDLVRQHTRASKAMDQAEALLNWGKVLHPAVIPSIELVRVFSQSRGLGDDLLAAVPNLWAIPPDATAGTDRQSFVLRPNESELNVTLQLDNTSVVPGKTYVMSFEYRNADLEGEQKVYVSAHTRPGVWVATFPDGAGYLARSVQAWTPGAFAFTVPPDTVMLQTWLRATGSGVGEFRTVKLRPAL